MRESPLRRDAEASREGGRVVLPKALGNEHGRRTQYLKSSRHALSPYARYITNPVMKKKTVTANPPCSSMAPCFFSPYHKSQWFAAMIAHASARTPSKGVVSTRSFFAGGAGEEGARAGVLATAAGFAGSGNASAAGLDISVGRNGGGDSGCDVAVGGDDIASRVAAGRVSRAIDSTTLRETLVTRARSTRCAGGSARAPGVPKRH